jgi:signal transduction histidine kinase
MAHRISALVLSQTELLANVSHELRTPLSRIRVALDLAAEGEPFDASAVGELSTDVAELEALIGTVLSTARLSLSEGRVVDGFGPDRRPVSVGQLMERTTERFRRSHPGRALQVDVSASSELAVDLDATLFPRALDNLLDNAAQYSDGAVTVRVLQLEPGRLRLEVVDEGIGMSADDLAKAFQPFFRADKSRTRATGGLGLGLALCRRIVEAHGGVVQLTSEPGRGTVATIELPLVAQSLHIPTHG